MKNLNSSIDSSKKAKNYQLITIYWAVIVVALFFLIKVGSDALTAASLVP